MHFGVGTININNNTNNATYRVSSIPDLLTVIQHFTAFPLISPKIITYKLWAEVVQLIATGQHLVPGTFSYIITIYAAQGASKAVIASFPNLIAIALPAYICPVTFNTINPWWINGFYIVVSAFTDNNKLFQAITNKYWHVFSVGFNIEMLPLVEVIADYINITFYIRSNGLRVDLMAQSDIECKDVISFFQSYPMPIRIRAEIFLKRICRNYNQG